MLNIKYVDKTGLYVLVNNINTVAKETSSDKTDIVRYYVKFISGRLADPKAMDFERNKKNAKYQPVKENVYQHYIKYLNTGGNTHLIEAERGVTRG